MKMKHILCSIKKIPLLCLLGVTIFLSDGIYDGILPWPSPFHITWAHSDRPDAAPTINTADRTPSSRQGRDVSGHGDPHAESRTNGNLSVDIGADISADGSAGGGADSGMNGGSAGDGADSGMNGGSAGGGTDSGMNGGSGSAGGGTDSGMNDGSGSANGVSQQENPADTGNEEPNAPDPMQPVLGEDGLPLVQYIQVEDDYFDDAVFIGDSRTRSLQLYANLEHTTFLADTGLTIYTVLDKKLTPSTMTAKTTVTDYLTNHQFKKIYLMLGINELGTGTAESFRLSYSEVLNTLRELQPDAIIYLQAILHISESKDKEHTYINNAAIIERNEALRSLADNESVFWLDSNPAVCDENGYLFDSYTFDGVHLQAKYVYLWTDYLKQHAILWNDSPYPQSPFPSPQAQAMP